MLAKFMILKNLAISFERTGQETNQAYKRANNDEKGTITSDEVY